MGNTRYFLSNSREIPVFPARMGNTHKSRDFANPVLNNIRSVRQSESLSYFSLLLLFYYDLEIVQRKNTHCRLSPPGVTCINHVTLALLVTSSDVINVFMMCKCV